MKEIPKGFSKKMYNEKANGAFEDQWSITFLPVEDRYEPWSSEETVTPFYKKSDLSGHGLELAS